MRRLAAFILALGVWQGRTAAAGNDPERFAVPLGGPSRGSANSKVTIVEWADFQCPFSSRVSATLEQIARTYLGEVQFFFRHNPLPHHKDAALAAEAAIAAEAQGQFWQMHDKLFANQQALDRSSLETYAQELGLDMTKFRAALDSHSGKTRVDEDRALAAKLGAAGTPNFFVNGRQIEGAHPLSVFTKVIDEELRRADALLAGGTPRNRLYQTLLVGARAAAAPARRSPSPGAGNQVYRVPAGDAPARGGPEPKVTIIEFAGFQCPFCANVEATLAQLLREYGNDVQLVFRHSVMPFHNNAMPAALAAEAAREQNKFWQMHDRLFARHDDLSPSSLEQCAREAGLDMAAFKASMDAKRGKPRVQRDIDLAATFGARGTPNFFINGRNFRGAQAIESFRKVINEELQKANARLAAGTPRAQLYAALTSGGLERVETAPEQKEGDPDPNVRLRADVDGAPVRGPEDALVTIVEWADFQCPYCNQVEQTLNRVLAEYSGKVRVVWRDMPLSFHDQAMRAAVAARAAGQQGKFWQMHDKLFEEQANLGPATYERFARQLGLDMRRFKAALASATVKRAVEGDASAGSRIGARGTPTFYINGRYLGGAHSFETFKAKIDEELRAAASLVARGTPAGKIYAQLMAGASAEHKRPGADAPEDDLTFYDILPGDAPAKGPKDAALVMIVFADFQCPYCKQLAPLLRRLEAEYAPDMRVVWKNFPLPAHANADSAAQAAMAAHAQGKFWAMHEKLFYYSPALDHESLEKYAQEIGLDLSKFKADMLDQRHEERIRADVREAESLGLRGTPAVFINGRAIRGVHPWETYRQIADAELAKKKQARRRNARR